MPLSSSSFTFCVILNLILCQIPRMDTIDAGMPIFCQAFCSDRRNIDIEDILTWPRLKQRRFTARDIPEMVTYQLRNISGNIAALSRKPRHNTNTASQPKQQFGLRGIGRLFPIIFFQSSIYICVFVLVCLVSKFSIGHSCRCRSALLYSYLPNWNPSSFLSYHLSPSSLFLNFQSLLFVVLMTPSILYIVSTLCAINLDSNTITTKLMIHQTVFKNIWKTDKMCEYLSSMGLKILVGWVDFLFLHLYLYL